MDLSSAHPVVSLMSSVLAPASAVGGSATNGETGKPSADFDSVPGSSLDHVDTSQQKVESVFRSFEMGNNSVDLHDMMFSLQKVNIDMQTTVQMRNELVSAYQSIMSMSI